MAAVPSAAAAPPEAPSGANVKVVCRFRPLNAKELGMSVAPDGGGGGGALAWELPQGCGGALGNTVRSREGDLDEYAFTFDSVLPLSSTQEDVYAVVEPVVRDPRCPTRLLREL